MKKEISWTKKVFALILSGVLLLSSIPVALATDNSTKDEPADEIGSAATEDEALSSNGYPKIAPPTNSSYLFYQDGDVVYIGKDDNSSKKMVTVSVNADDLDPGIAVEMAESIQSMQFKQFTANYSDLGDTVLKSVELIDNNAVVYKEDKGVFLFRVDLRTIPVDDQLLGFSIVYKDNDNELHEIYKTGVYCATLPTVSGIKYDGKDESEMEWVNTSIEIEATVTESPVFDYVTIDGDTASLNGSGEYVMTVSEARTAEIRVYNKFGTYTSAKTASIKSDTSAPFVEYCNFVDENGSEFTGWSNDKLTLKVNVQDTESGADASSIKLSDGTLPIKTESEGNSASAYFEISEKADFTIEFADKVGNSDSYDVPAENVNIDKEAPKASDFTLTFSDAQNAGDKFLNFLTFGAYSNKDVKITIDVNDNDLSEIASVKLYNGETEIEKNGDAFILTAPENDGEAVEYDLFVEATDKAGNSSGKIRFNESKDIKTKLSDGDAVRDLSENLYEVVLSKVVPSLDETYADKGVNRDFAHITENDGKYYVSGNGTISVKLTEANTGIKEIKATLDGGSVPVSLSASQEGKVTEQIASVSVNNLSEGEHTVKFYATANSGMQETYEVSVISVKKGPQLNGALKFSNQDESGKQSWVNTDVDITFALKDSPVDVASVKYYKYADKTNTTDVEKTTDGYKFTVGEYATYTVVATDVLGNVSEFKTSSAVLIDKSNPEVVNEKFDYTPAWINKSVKIKFNVKDNPAVCSGVSKVTVDGEEIAFTGGKCEFEATEYGSHSVIVYDAAGNFSKTYTVGPVNIDLIAPEVKSVTFSAANKVNEYGIYAKEDLTMSVVFVDPLNGSGVCSNINMAEIRESKDGAALSPDSSTLYNNEFTINYTLKKENTEIRNYYYYVTDNAGNEAEFKLVNNSTVVNVDESAVLYEVVATLATPDISDIKESFTKKYTNENDGKTYYSGSGKFTSSIKDELAGIDSYSTYFVKKDAVHKDADGNITSVDGTPLTDEKEVSKDSKKTSIDKVEIETPSVDQLESGEYTAVIYAKNLSGNGVYNSFDVIVDNTAPQITGYSIETSGDTHSNYGVYSDSDINVTVSFADDVYSTGIKSVKFYNGNTELGDEKVTVSGNKATITLSACAQYLLSAKVIDNFDHDTGVIAINSGVEVRLNGKEIKPDKNNFEIVVNNDYKKLEYSDPDYSFSPYEYTEQNKKTTIRVLKATSDNGTITASLENSLSGIKTVETKLVFNDTQDVTSSDNAEKPKATVKVSNNSSDKDAYGKFIRQTITIDAKQIHQSGKYDLTISAVDMCGNENELTDTFYIDETAPDYVSMDIHKAPTSIGDQVLNVLSFGIFSNNDLEATVTIEDKGPTAGLTNSCISLMSNSGLSVTEKDDSLVVSDGDTLSGKKYKITYVLHKTDNNYIALTKSSYKDLKFWCKDNFDNSQYDRYEYVPGNVTAQVDKNVKYAVTLGKDDIVASAYAPEISNVKLTGDNRYTDGDNVWFSNNPTFEFDANDEVSRLHSFSVTLNGTDVSAYCVCNGSQNNYNFTTFNDNNADTDLSGIHVVLNPNTVKAFMREGENKIAYTVTSNNSISFSGERNFFVDLHNPVINSFTFTDAVAPEAQNDNKANGVVNTNYGHFFQVDTIVTVTATDNIIADIPVSGVKDIILFKKDINGSKQQVAMYQRLNTNQATFVIERGFKGQIYAYAVDNVENNRQAYDFTPGVATDGMSVFTPDSVIDETEYQHVANSKLTITPVNEPSNRDNKDNPLYNHDVTLTIFAESSFAGIKSVEFKIYADNFGEINDYRYDCQVDMNGSVAGDWTVLGTENNLVTKVSRNIVISNNYNDITVEAILTDRCGIGNKDTNVSHAKYKFSIDKTAPHIDVQFSPASGNKVDNGDYYKTDRVATITVTERNFNPDDFKLTIRNPHNPGQTTLPISGVSNWNTTYSVDVSNPDAITHVATVTFHDDGDYEMTSAFTDRAGNEADNNNKKESEFTVDQTLPKISITFDVNNPRPYYNVTRTATIRIEEHNFHTPYVDIKQTAFGADNSTPATPPSVSAWSTSGDVSTATITFADDGKYSFTVDFKDKALNEAVQQREGDFYVDKKIDKIEIVNVKDLTAYDGTIAPEIHYFDQNFDTATYLLKRIDFGKAAETVDDLTVSEGAGNGFSKIVTYADFERITKNDGIYDLSADITDLAGNKDHKEVVFSVNRFGSTFMISDETTKQLVEDKFYTNNAPDIVVTEINVNEVSDPDIQVNCDDASQTLKKDTDYTITASGGQNQWYSYDYKIFKQNFVNEGNYTVTVSSKDHFDNVVSNKTAYKSETENRTCPVKFVVDKTAPIVTISGIDSNEYYKEAEKEVIVSCEDANITGENLTVELDGERFVSYDKDETSGNIELKLSLQADGNNNERDFKVTVTDKAGNKNEDGEVTGFILGASWLARLFRYNLPLVIIVGALVLGGIAFGVVMAVRKNNKKKAES